MALSPGGKAGNQAAQAALNGARTFLVGRVGRDVFGDQLRAALARTGVDTTYVTVDAQEATGISPVFTGADGEYASIIVPGAGQSLQPEDIEAAQDAFARSACSSSELVGSPESPSTPPPPLPDRLGGRVSSTPPPLLPMPRPIPDPLWSVVDVLLVNGAEAERLSGSGEPTYRRRRCKRGAPAAVRHSDRHCALGGRGAVALDEGGIRHLPSLAGNGRRDHRGGGCVRGSPGQRLARGRQLDEALPLANAAGALAVTRPGAHDSLPTGAQIRAFLTERGARTQSNDGC